jgi:outer membrane protein TolC
LIEKEKTAQGTPMKRSWFIVLFILSFMSKGFSEESIRLTAEDLPKFIQEKNQNVTGAKLLTKASELRTGHLARSYLPTVSLQGGGEKFQTGTYRPETQPYASTEAKLNLYRGGRDALEEEVRRGQVRISSALERRTYATELNDARKQYWTLVFQRELKELLKEAVEHNEKNLVSANRRVERGLATKTDQVEFQIKQSQVKEDIESLDHEIFLNEKRLSAILGLSLNTRFDTPKLIPHQPQDAYLQSTFDPETNQEVALLRANRDVSASQRSQNDRWWLPSVDLYSEYALYTLRDRDYLSARDRDDYAFGIKFTIDLFDGLRSKSEANAFSAQAKAYENQASQRARVVDANFQTAQEEMKHLNDLIHKAEKRIEQGKDYLTSSLEEYDLGVKNSLDILYAVERYISYRQRAIELKRDYQITRGELLMISGE